MWVSFRAKTPALTGDGWDTSAKQGNTLLRFLLVEAAQAAVRWDPDWRRRYLHLAMRRDRRTAKVAMARRLGARL
jgi:transposase